LGLHFSDTPSIDIRDGVSLKSKASYMGVSLHGFLLETGFQTEIKKTITKWVQRKLTHSVAPSPAFKGGVKRLAQGQP